MWYVDRIDKKIVRLPTKKKIIMSRLYCYTVQCFKTHAANTSKNENLTTKKYLQKHEKYKKCSILNAEGNIVTQHVEWWRLVLSQQSMVLAIGAALIHTLLFYLPNTAFGTFLISIVIYQPG